MYDSETLKTLARHNPHKSDSDEYWKWMSDKLEGSKQIKNNISQLNQAIYAERERHQKELKDIERKRGDIQGKCPHLSSSFNADPAGGRDSWYECDFCGKEI